MLKIAHFNERLLAIPSDHSGQKSDCEQIAQVAHDKRATVSELLRSLDAHDKRAAVSNLLRLLMIKERISKLLRFF